MTSHVPPSSPSELSLESVQVSKIFNTTLLLSKNCTASNNRLTATGSSLMTVTQIQSFGSWWSCHSFVVSAMLTMLSSYSRQWRQTIRPMSNCLRDPPRLFVCQSISQTVTQSVCQSVGWSACQSASRSVRKSVSWSSGRSSRLQEYSYVNFSRIITGHVT